MGDAGEKAAAAQSNLFDGGKTLKGLKGKTASSAVAASGGKKCFSGFTAASKMRSLQTKSVPLTSNFSFTKTSAREKKALSSVIPGGAVVMEKYLAFQKQAYDKVYGVLDRAGWGARRRRGRNVAHVPYRMTVHHTQGHQAQGVKDTARTVKNTQHYHMVGRAKEGKKPFSDIGYHFLISGDGVVAQGRPSTVLGAHAGGANKGNIGIALMGDFNKLQPTQNQMESLKRLIAYTGVKHNINPRSNGWLHGHSQYSNTDCPGSNLRRILSSLRSAAAEEMLAMKKRTDTAIKSAGTFSKRFASFG
jgi:N-acetylmuramoyl-L-alanine amidase